jgi:hypothetical protein
LSDWSGGDRLPDAVQLPDGVIVPLGWDDYMAAEEEHRLAHPRSRAKYTPMNTDGTVRLLLESGSDGRDSGSGWSTMDVIAPKGSRFLYGGYCVLCGPLGAVEYSTDPTAQRTCVNCQAEIDWQEAEVERARKEAEEAEREWLRSLTDA